MSLQSNNKVNQKSKVAVVYTKPETVMDDIEKAMDLAGCTNELQKTTSTLSLPER